MKGRCVLCFNIKLEARYKQDGVYHQDCLYLQTNPYFVCKQWLCLPTMALFVNMTHALYSRPIHINLTCEYMRLRAKLYSHTHNHTSIIRSSIIRYPRFCLCFWQGTVLYMGIYTCFNNPADSISGHIIMSETRVPSPKVVRLSMYDHE